MMKMVVLIVKKVVEGENNGILLFNEYCSCMYMSCKPKVVNVNGGIGECSRCGMMMKVIKCKKQATAKVTDVFCTFVRRRLS